MPTFSRLRQITAAEAMEQLPPAGGPRFLELFRHASLSVELYAPRGHDPQQPHTRDEIYVVLRGRGTYVNGTERMEFGPGDVLFAAAGEVHRFEDFSDDFFTWVLFYGPEGGERRALEQDQQEP